MRKKLATPIGVILFALGFCFPNVQEAEAFGTHTCYDTFELGKTYYNVNCSGCTAQRNKSHLDQSTCTTGGGNPT